MPQTSHTETHFTGGELVRDMVIGMSDGLTVPFALAAGLSGAVSSSHVVVVAGLAEIAAGSIAMGLGGFLAARSDAEHYEQELLREKREVETIADAEAKEVSDIFQSYGLPGGVPAGGRRAAPQAEGLGGFHDALRVGAGRAGSRPGPAQPADHRACLHCRRTRPAFSLHSRLEGSRGFRALGCGYADRAFHFGFVKARYTGAPTLRGALQTLVIGALAAGAAYLIARWIS